MSYAIGLDIGIASVGYSVLALDSSDEPYRIVRLGSRIFEKAENPKNGDPLALPRRQARSMRRRLRRRRHRKERIRGMILSEGILTAEALDSLYDGEKLSCVYELRVKALDKPLTAEEFARVLIHISQRRGFLSNRKNPNPADKENGALLQATGENRALMQEKGYRTVGEMFFLDGKFAEYKRNKAGNYSHTVDRALVEEEVKAIFSAQRGFGMSFAAENVEERYLSILMAQRSFAEGPACGPYSGNQIEKMIGRCTFETEEPRAAKATYSFQLFNLWQHINHIRIVSEGGETRALSDEERHLILNEAHQKEKLTFDRIRKLLSLQDGETFNLVRYTDSVEEAEKKKTLDDLKIYHEIRKAYGKEGKELFKLLTHEQLDAIGEAFSKNYSDDKIIALLTVAGIDEAEQGYLLKLNNYPKYGHLSLKACRKLLPHLESGMTYDKACETAGYDFKGGETNKGMTLPPLSEDDESIITSPVVRRAVSQSIKVINAIIREMGESPVYINIELARELSKNMEERKKIEKRQDENAKRNEKAMGQVREYVENPTGFDLVKYKLWEEQGGICPYSQKPISLSRLFEVGYVDVDHIVPYSRSFDDRMTNKVLVFASENRQKGNRLPLEYLQGDKRDKFTVWVKSCPKFTPAKRKLLLKEAINDEEGFRARNLQDTQFITSFLYGFIVDHLLFAPSVSGKKRRVFTVNGAITSYARRRWGLAKVREDGDLHHALDATVIACITPGMVAKITRYMKYHETRYSEVGEYTVDPATGEVVERFPMPWEDFRNELTIRLCDDGAALRKQLNDVNFPAYLDVDLDTVKAPFVSRMSNHKITGPAHKETMRSGRLLSKGMTVSKVDLTSLKLDKNGEIADYYNPDSDRLLYSALKKRLHQFDGDAKKAFAEPFHKPCADGTPGPVVKKVKVTTRTSLTVDVLEHTAVADNDTMVRCDVFYVPEDGYYFVPVYVADTVKDTLPNKACVAGGRPWKVMDEQYFVFSLYPRDLIKVYDKKDLVLKRAIDGGTLPEEKAYSGRDGVFLYYRGLDIATGVLSGITHDGTYLRRSIGKTTLKIEKYTVDVLGNIQRVHKETRQGFASKKK